MKEKIKYLCIEIRSMGLLSGIRYSLGIAKEGVDFWTETPMPESERYPFFHTFRVIKSIIS